MEHSENISIFSIPGHFPGNISWNFIGIFFRIFREYIMGCSTNIPRTYVCPVGSIVTKTLHLKHFQIFQHPYIDRKYKRHLHTNKSQLLIMIREDHLHMKKGEKRE